MAALGTGSKQGTTEWEDILRSKGILPPEKSADELAADTLKAMVEDRVDTYDPHANKDVDELDVDLEEADEEEEAILRQYRDTRLAEMKELSGRRRYGPGLTFISATDWKAEVTNAGDDVPVIVFLVRFAGAWPFVSGAGMRAPGGKPDNGGELHSSVPRGLSLCALHVSRVSYPVSRASVSLASGMDNKR